jgi:F-type H+-transporting ATPase subunit a
MQVDPIHQFEIKNLAPLATMGGHQFNFTNSALMMFIIVGAVSTLLIGATASRAVVPGRLQSIAEMSYEFVANTVRSSAGTEGMKFFPFVFTLFMFILFANLIGLIPYSFTVTSQLIVTAALALLVFFIVVGYGFWRNGLHFLNLFVPKGVPKAILPAIVVIEVLSFVSRPVSHSVRLFANMLAGHITLQVFAGFIIMLAGFGVLGWLGAALPFAMVVMLTALELLVAFLQAYVFAILTCIRPPRNTSGPALPVSAWAAPVSAWASSSATTLPRLCAIRRPRKASSATLFSGLPSPKRSAFSRC